MQIPKVLFTKEKETLLVTLYGRALDNRSKAPVLADRWAAEAIARIDYEFGAIKIRPIEPLSIAIRAKQFDLWTAEFIGHHPDATVMHLGCGLDSRVFRLDPPASVRWFDVDYPDVVELRRHLYPDREGYRLIGSSLADLDWLDQVPGDRPAWIVAEGVTMYLTEDIMKPLLNRLIDHFPGGEIAFDAISQWATRLAKANPSVRATGASFGWGINYAEDIKRLDPRLEVIVESRTPELPGYSRLPAATRALVRVFDLIPALRRANRLLRYRFPSRQHMSSV